MKVKVYISSNYFILENEDGLIYPGLAKNVIVRIKDAEAADPAFLFYNVEGWSSNNPLKLSNIQKEDGTAYTLAEFKTFYEGQTGKSNAGSSAEPPITQAEYDALAVKEAKYYYVI